MTLLSMLDVRVNPKGTTHTACYIRGPLDKIFAAPDIADAAYCPEGATSYVAITVRGTAQDAMNTLALLGIDRPQDCPPLEDEDFDAAGWAITMRDQSEGPRMGDFVRGQNDRLKRIAAVHQTVLQTTDGTLGASFYLDDDGT